MPRLYSLIEDQINNLFRFQMEDENGSVQYNKYIQGPKMLRPVISFVAAMIFLLIILTFGIYLWNHGLSPVMPNIFMKIDSMNPSQFSNSYIQLFITLLGLSMVF